MKRYFYYILIIIFLLLILVFKIFSSYNNTSYLFSSYHGFEVSGDTIIRAEIDGENVVIPSVIDGVTITKIGDNAFNGLNIDSVVFPDTIISIGDYAFANNNIKNLKLPSSIQEIGEGAFIHNKIQLLEISSNVYFGNACFNDNKLDSEEAFFYNNDTLVSYGGEVKGNVKIPSNIDLIGEKAFFETYIISVSIPEGVTTIMKDAFKSNYLVEVFIPKNINSIDDEAFVNNSYLTEIIIDNSSSNFLNYPWGADKTNLYWLK